MSTRERVLERLRQSPGAVSGEVIARELGVSRVAVGKHVAALRAAGYEIIAEQRTGYRLISCPDLAVPWEVAPLLREPLWDRVVGDEVTGSTNDDARELAREGAPHGTAVVAARQTSGRGRLGRTWESPAGGAYISVVLRPPVAPSNLSSLPLAVAVGAAWGLERLGARPGIKWPNDIWLGERKLAGILLEMAAEGDRVDWVVVGIGVNIHRQPDSSPDVAYLSDQCDAGIAEATAAVMDGFAQAYARWIEDGFASLAADFGERAVLSGRDVVVRDAWGGVIASGIVEGVDPAGRLTVRTGDGTTVDIVAGDVTLRRSAD